MASLLKRRGVYYAQFHDQSRTPQRRRFSLRTKRKATARHLLTKLEDDWRLGRFDPWTDDPHAYDRRTVEEVTTEEAQERFLKAKRQAGRSKETLLTYRGILRRQGAPRRGDAPQARESTPGPCFHRRGLPASSTRRKRYRHLRASELGRLRWRDLELKNGLLHLREQKSRREELLPLSQKAVKVLEGLGEGSPEAFVFSGPRQEGTERSIKSFRETVSKRFLKYRRKAEIERPITFHGLRHGFCTALAEVIGISESVTLMGAQPHEVVREEMQEARAYVQHSLTVQSGDSEGLPSPSWRRARVVCPPCRMCMNARTASRLYLRSSKR